MQLVGATRLERELYDVCLLWEQQPCSEFQTRVSAAMSEASKELQHLREQLDGANRKVELYDRLNTNQATTIHCMGKEITDLRAALLPFAAAAGRPGRLLNSMTDEPLPDNAVLAIGVKVAAWKRAHELMGA